MKKLRNILTIILSLTILLSITSVDILAAEVSLQADISVDESSTQLNKASNSNNYFSKIWDSSVTKTDARIHGDLARPTTVKEAGFYIGTSESNMQKNSKKDGYFTGCENIAYTMSEYYGTLKSGTKYYYKLYYITTSGVERCSPVGWFATEAGNVVGDFSQKTNSYFSKVTTVSLGKTDARIYGDLAKATTVKEAGFYIGTSESNLKKNTKKDGKFTGCENIAYTMSEYYGRLTPGTKYYYKLYYITTDGTERSSPVNYFVTEGESTDFILTLYFNANGGITDSDKYIVKNDMVYHRDTLKEATQKWSYDNAKENGLVNGVGTLALYKKGYTFVGWAVSASGGTIFKDDDSSLKPSEINPNLVYGSCSTTLYAQWKKTNDIYNLGEETYSFCNFGDSDSPGGHCFGMSMTSAGYYLNELDITYLDLNDSSKLYSVSQTSKVNAPICHYQGIQGEYAEKSVVAGGSIYNGYFLDITSDWNEAVNYVNNGAHNNKGSIQILYWGYYFDGDQQAWGGHAVNFLRFEKVNGQDRIYVYDNNFPDAETYFYEKNGYIYQAPYSTIDAQICSLALCSVSKYFDMAGGFDSSKVIYAYEGDIEIDGVEGLPMIGAIGERVKLMYEVGDNIDSVTITPLVDNAEFEYINRTYTFGNKTKDTVGVLKLASMNVEGITEVESDFIIKTTPKKVNSVWLGDVSLNYKSSTTLIPDISSDEGVEYTVAYSSSDTSVATVDENGNVYAAGDGTAEITCTVTDEYGNVVTDTCEVNVSYAWWQWIIRILLLGFLWY